MNIAHSDGEIDKQGSNLTDSETATERKPTPSSESFADIVRLIVSQNNPPTEKQQQQQQQQQQPEKRRDIQTNMVPASQQQPVIKRSCRAPLTRRFAHPCGCSQSSSHLKSHSISSLNVGSNNTATGSNSTLPPAAYTLPIQLYDPWTKKCLPTSRSRDMLLKECRVNVASPYPVPHQLYHTTPCVYDDLVCDARRNRCTCKPPLHLFYESINNGTQPSSTFGCVPLGPPGSPDGRITCKSGQFYNVISKDCQKIFDVSELPPNYTTGVSATQFSFVTIVLIWILLLILIVTAKLRKLRTAPVYRDSPAERRLHRGSQNRQQIQGGASTWLHPFIAAVNGHHHLNQHRTNVDRHNGSVDDTGNFNDTDFFLANGNRRLNELFSDGNFAGSQLSLNNPPPKFEEIYPSCPEEQQQQQHQQGPQQPLRQEQQQNQQEQTVNIQTPSSEDLPTYDEAMRLQNTIPPNQKE